MFRRVVVLAVSALLAALVLGVPTAASAHSAHHHVVLGKKHLFEPYGHGWGKAHPRSIFNGGDPSGLVQRIHWSHWGRSVSRGHGLTSTFKPQGGYYAHPVKIKLRASRIGRCSTGGPRAYKQLHIKVQKRPGSKHWTHWFSWSDLKSICARHYTD